MKTLIINGHPNKNSYCSQLAAAYYSGAQKRNSEAHLLHLYELHFDVSLKEGYSGNLLEPDLLRAQELITWSDHIVFVYPTWWWTMPALLKGFIDRVFVPGFAFKYESDKPLPEKLLKHKTATLLVTMDSPKWYYRWWMKNAGHWIMKQGILAFCGINKTKVVTIDQIRKLTPQQRNRWIEKVEAIAMQR
ncbi:NAD(P)H-dependent oxidoreductase [Cytophagaceae bacterium YF14B1]|uniref:NAD(P)H-dependent oxidoreductase n=1 Tax=Xanthocytophaga flava TaxID=3048013 RepID=A0AAE3QVJ7_9BACT|nr:NAD(P)H-dependent oxidoreductase [Xanthocytophaga flavus]MDJ1483353.1 NAD(P)H-dependent oxidoreductase [Xanthocytophaga flavus]